MVYSYSAPFETGKLSVSDIHTLQSDTLPHFHFLVHVPDVVEDSYEVSGTRDGTPGALRCVCAAAPDNNDRLANK